MVLIIFILTFFSLSYVLLENTQKTTYENVFNHKKQI